MAFQKFYAHYLSLHQNPTCRRLHFLGSFVALAVFVYAILTGHWWLCLLAPFTVYPFAWSGHFFFEGNRPATFTHPFLSARADVVMAWQICRGKIQF